MAVITEPANGEKVDYTVEPLESRTLSSIDSEQLKTIVETSLQRRKMVRRTQNRLFTILLLLLFTIGAVCGSTNNLFRRNAASEAGPVPEPEQVSKFQELLNSIEPSSLHDFLHKHLKEKYQHGIYQEDKQAMEAVYSHDAEAATSLVELAKRQANGSSKAPTGQQSTPNPTQLPSSTNPPQPSTLATTPTTSQPPTQQSSIPTKATPSLTTPSTPGSISTTPTTENKSSTKSTSSQPSSQATTPTTEAPRPATSSNAPATTPTSQTSSSSQGSSSVFSSQQGPVTSPTTSLSTSFKTQNPTSSEGSSSQAVPSPQAETTSSGSSTSLQLSSNLVPNTSPNTFIVTSNNQQKTTPTGSSPNAETSPTTFPSSITQRIVYKTTLADGAQTTVTSITVVPAQADGTGAATKTSHGAAGLQTGAATIERSGFNAALLGALGIVAAVVV